MVSTPAAVSRLIALPLENRETAMTLRATPAASDARRAMAARLGPILPPAPRMTMSPCSLPIASMTPGVGSLRASSSASTVAIRFLVMPRR